MPVIRIKKCLLCGVKHEWMFDGATLKELRVIKQLTGMNARQFAESGDDLDPDAIAALLVILHQRDKINASLDDVDIDFNDFAMDPTEDEKKAIEELEAQMQKAAESENGPKASLISNGKKSKAG